MEEAPGVAALAAEGEIEDELENNPVLEIEDEGTCVQEIVHCLLDAKGASGSTLPVQVAINSSVIQLAKANFPLVISSLCSFLDNRHLSEGHQLWLLRLLCQVLETRRSEGESHELSCSVDQKVAENLTNHLVREIAALHQDDNRQRAITDVLVELAPMHPDVVLSGVLAALDSSGGSGTAPASAPPALVNVLTEIAYTTPHALEGRIHEVMGRYLPLLQASKTSEVKILLFRAWCSLCVALVNCATRGPGDPMSSTESTFSQVFGAAALELRRKQAPISPGTNGGLGGGGGLGSGRSGMEEVDETRRVQQVLSTAFAMLMSSWQSSKDMNVRIGAMETLGHLCLVIPKDLFLTNADALLELLVNLLTRQSAASSSLPPVRLMRGLCLLLQACIDADPEILLLENALQTLTSTMFAWTVSSGPLQHLQSSLGTESLQSQAEVLRCFEVLAETFRKQVLGFLMQRARGGRDDRLGALLVLRHLIGSASWRPRPAAVVEGIQHLTGDSDPSVGLLLGELIVALAAADFFADADAVMAEVAAAGAQGGANTAFVPEDMPRQEQINALLNFLIRQTALKQITDAEQSSYVAKLVAKSTPTDLPSCEEVRGSAGLVLGHLAGSLKPSVRTTLWPMLLQALLDPCMRQGLPVLCRAVTQIVSNARAATPNGASQAIMAELAGAFRAGKEKSTQPEALLLWLLICAHSPHEPPGSGIAIIRCLESLSPLIHRVLGDIWQAPSTRLQTLCTCLEEAGSMFDPDFWSLALSQEVHFFLSALPEHDDLPAKLVDILGGLHLEIWRKDRDACELSECQRAALMNLNGACLSHVGQKDKVNSSLDFLMSHSSDLITEPTVRRAYARALGMVAQRHFELVLGVLGRVAKTDAATRRAGSIAQSLFGKSTAVQQAECLRSMLALALGYCAVYAPSPEVLQTKVCDDILSPLGNALTQEGTVLVLRGVIEAVRLTSDAIRGAPENAGLRDPFLQAARGDEGEQPGARLSQDPSLRAALCLQRDGLVRALLPFVKQPPEGETDEPKLAMFQELICPALNAISSLIAMPFDLPSNLYASVLEDSLSVLIFSLPNGQMRATGESFSDIDPVLSTRIQAVTSLVKSLLFHANSWLGVSRLLQAVHAAGANCPVEFIRWTCTQLLGELCKAAPILSVTTGEEGEEMNSDVGDWCECLALLLPRTGDSCKAVVAVAIDALQQLLSRCEWTASVNFGALGEASAPAAVELGVAKRRSLPREGAAARPVKQGQQEGDPAPPSQQLVSALVARLPPSAIPPLVQHLMLAMHDADSHAALSGVDALYLILQACCDKLSKERATNLVATVFEEVEKVSHSSVRQKVLSCVKVLALHHFESAVSELLDTGPEFNMSSLGALQVLAKEKALLLRLLNYFTDTLNNSDPGTMKRPNRLVLAATVALGHLFTVNDSSIGMVVKKYFPQLFGTFLLRIGTTLEGLSAQQTAAAFMNFLHASQNDSMAMALEGNRLSRVTRELYDEVICELTMLFCRHHPSKRDLLLTFIHPFLTRPFPGHRVAAVTTLSQLLLSGVDSPLSNELVSLIVDSLLRCIDDAHSTVRKQSVRGLGNLLLLWQRGLAEAAMEDEDLALRRVLPAVCRALSDEVSLVQREAVVAVQRACEVEILGQPWRQLLLESASHLQPLVDAEDATLRGASLDLLSCLCGLSLELSADPIVATDTATTHGSSFGESLDVLLVHCVVRLEDTLSPVATAASRCLQQLVAAARAPLGPGLAGDGGSSLGGTAAEAAELLQRREQEQMEFNQFVFPFVALVHRSGDPMLVARRLEICRGYLTLGLPPGEGEGADVAGVGLRRSMPTAVAAGYVAAALARCLGEMRPRPTELLCRVCRDLLGLLAVEDSEFRAQVAKILGFFDILVAA